MNDQTDVQHQVSLLVRSGRLREAEEKLSDLLGSMPDKALTWLEWIKIASLRAEHETALERLSAAQKSFPSIDWSDVLIEVLIRARRLSRAEQVIRDTINRNRRAAISKADRLLRVQTLLKMEKSFRAATEHEHRDFISICINLDQHTEKWERARQEGTLSNLNILRLPGIKGSYLADRLLPLLGRGVSKNFKGTLGCFLSHFAAWERLLASDLDHALIVEDDFRPLLSLPSSISSLGLPPEHDVCFINERMQTTEIGEFGFIPVPEVVAMRASPRWAACGNEGYIVSRKGAEKLIQRVIEDGFFGDSDWRMLSYCVVPEHVSRLDSDSFASKALKAHLHVVRPREPLQAFAASIGIIGLVDTGSGRVDQNIGQHAHDDISSANASI
jgi:hypothetical protein